MSAGAAPVGANPFNPRTILALVLFGAMVFVGLLWLMGSGMTDGSSNDGGAHGGGAHGGGKGLVGYAALADLLERQGYAVGRSQTDNAFGEVGLLVLTPQANADGAEIGRIIEKHRNFGPTLLVLPKWQVLPTKSLDKRFKPGWVAPVGTAMADWADKLEGYKLEVRQAEAKDSALDWQGLDESGRLPDGRVQFANADELVPLVTGAAGQTYAGYWQDEGFYPDLAKAAGIEAKVGEDSQRFALIIVAEPDLINNWGMADQNRAMLALKLVSLAEGGRRDRLAFDLTLNGFKRPGNLLTLAFTPPFLAATLCLLIAALVAGWRAFCRDAPPVLAGRTMAFGKRALVENSAGLILRSGRLHLLGAPYAAMTRDRLARTLALPRAADAAATEAAIDRALANRAPDAEPFSRIAAQLRWSRRARDLLRAGRALHSLERTLTR